MAFGLISRAFSVLLPVAVIFLTVRERSGGEVLAAPLFGLGTLLSAFDDSTNSTSLLSLLVEEHIQHKLDTIAQLAELFGLATGNLTAVAR